jgi:hypothetical protein
MTAQQNWAIGAGLLSALLFFMTVSGNFPSLFLAYTPYFPLLLAGLATGEKAVLSATAIAAVGALLSAGFGGLMIFLMMYGFPVAYFVLRAVMRTGRYRPSIGRVMTGLTCYMAILTSLLILAVEHHLGGFASLLPEPAEGELTPLMETVRTMMVEQTYLLLGGSAWVQLLIFYGIAVLANFLLTGFTPSLRESLAIRPFMPSAWLLLALMACGLCSFSTDSGFGLVGRTGFIILLFPYFLMGISKLHRKVRDWKSRRLTLWAVYLSLCVPPLTQILLLGLVGTGLLSQGRYLSNRFGGTDS